MQNTILLGSLLTMFMTLSAYAQQSTTLNVQYGDAVDDLMYWSDGKGALEVTLALEIHCKDKKVPFNKTFSLSSGEKTRRQFAKLMADAIKEALEDAGCKKEEIDELVKQHGAAVYVNSTPSPPNSGTPDDPVVHEVDYNSSNAPRVIQFVDTPAGN